MLIILFLFLRNIRGALIVILALPLSLLLTFTVMKNLASGCLPMSLGGLAISIGMIIDSTIIQVENAQQHLTEKGGAAPKPVSKAILEVRKPSIFGELIIALTFIPIVALQGMEGKMFAPLALTVVIALFSSLLLSLYVIPALCSLFLRAAPRRRARCCPGPGGCTGQRSAGSMRHKRMMLGLALVLLAGSSGSYPSWAPNSCP